MKQILFSVANAGVFLEQLIAAIYEGNLQVRVLNTNHTYNLNVVESFLDERKVLLIFTISSSESNSYEGIFFKLGPV